MILGYAYGKGLYFANCFITSACYCSGPENTRLILLNKVALGKVGPYKGGYTPTSYLSKGCNSCIGFACKNFKEDAYEKLNGIKVPVHSVSFVFLLLQKNIIKKL